MSRKYLYAEVGVAQIPHILSMVDRNLLSPTYGCFDRSYWHYKTSPFPSGMYQEFVLPLALCFLHPIPKGERFYRQPRLRELVVAGIRYAAASSHRDGSCDDYFPYERALGAAAFSLYAATESYLLLGLSEDDIVSFFHKRGNWLMRRQEAGRLSNHHALVVLALYNVYLITGEQRYLQGARRRLELLLGWQTEEGWFPEYEGCDPGYLTATIDFLAKYLKKSQDERVVGPLKAAVLFARQFIHPDGSYGGEYGSRNTCIFFPHGFELMGEFLPEAIETAELYLRGVSKGLQVHLEDDRMCAHLAWDHLQAYLDFRERTPDTASGPRKENRRRYWQMARIYVHAAEDRYAVVSAAKGGVLRLFVSGELAYGDSGIIARLSNGMALVSHSIGDYEVTLLEDGIQVLGSFSKCGFERPTPLTQAIFHLGMLTVGRWGSDIVRLLLQKLLITGARRDPMKFRRTFRMGPPSILVDEIWNPRRGRSREVIALYAGTDHTSIYVAMSNSFQSASLLPWTDYGVHLAELNRDGYVRIERRIG